ncbi:MAG: hypothetical protein J6D57_04140 [Mogibacterium sp.]|nr:hypothetical protein [Mogibacterium sp.]
MSKLALELLHGQGETTLPTMKPAASEKRATGGALTQQVNASEAAVSSTVQIKETDAESQKPEIKLDLSKVKIEPLFEEEVDFDTFSKSDFRAVKIKNCEEVPKSDKLLKFTLNDGTGEDRIILSGIKAYYDPAELVGKTAIAIVNLPPRKMMGEYSNGMLISAVNEYDGDEMLNLLLVDDRIPAGAKLY